MQHQGGSQGRSELPLPYRDTYLVNRFGVEDESEGYRSGTGPRGSQAGDRSRDTSAAMYIGEGGGYGGRESDRRRKINDLDGQGEESETITTIFVVGFPEDMTVSISGLDQSIAKRLRADK